MQFVVAFLVKHCYNIIRSLGVPDGKQIHAAVAELAYALD